MTSPLFWLQPLPPVADEIIKKYLDEYYKGRGDYGWLGWLLMTAVLAVVATFFWFVLKFWFSKLITDIAERDKTTVVLVKESVAIQTAVKTTMDSAGIERQVLINKIDALEAVNQRLELVITYQGKAVDRLEKRVEELAAGAAQAAMACRAASLFVAQKQVEELKRNQAEIDEMKKGKDDESPATTR